jgi:hypothetical protein
MPEKLNVAGAAPAPDFLTAAELGPVDELLRARLERLRAQIMFASGRGRDDRSRRGDYERYVAPHFTVDGMCSGLATACQPPKSRFAVKNRLTVKRRTVRLSTPYASYHSRGLDWIDN